MVSFADQYYMNWDNGMFSGKGCKEGSVPKTLRDQNFEKRDWIRDQFQKKRTDKGPILRKKRPCLFNNINFDCRYRQIGNPGITVQTH